jgi:diaminohydroxyphosphoribosylaminopyrimidine deaminase/5-amino-6-(5-phosphoribosylamino)uracil reductase
MPAEIQESDVQWMRRATRLAMNGRGRVEPNPMVGCVIVKDSGVIGEGFHEVFGGPHAEPNALSNCIESPAGATLYTTLEPCCHTGKKTPPCVPRLIEAKVARVVIGSLDPHPLVDGRGAAQLRAARIEVTTPVLEPQCKQLLAPYFARAVHHRPYVTLKWAETADGKVGAEGSRVHISNPTSTAVIHQLRSRCDAIIVGSNTVLADDPLLTVRGVEVARPLLRVVLDRRLRTPLTSRLVQTAREGPVRIYTSSEAVRSNRMTIVPELERRGVEVRPIATTRELLADLYECGATHVLVEPGPTLGTDWLRQSPTFVDRVWVIRSTKTLGTTGIAAPEVPASYRSAGELDLDSDRLTEYLNPASAVFFAAESSADFVLAGR